MSEPLISVVIPCYRQAHFLPACVASLQRQGVQAWEAIVVDDGSPDNTAQVVQGLAAQDARVRLLRKANGGLSSARNAGMAAARGTWLQFLDADDELLAGRFMQHQHLLAADPALDMSICDWQALQPSGQTHAMPMSQPRLHSAQPWLELALRWEHDLSIPVHCVLLRRGWVQQHGCVFDEQLPNHEDWSFWMDVWQGGPRVAYTGEVGALYRMHAASMTRDDGRMYRGYLQALALQLHKHPQHAGLKQALARKRRIVDLAYGFNPAGRVRKFFATGPLKQVLPWPWQKWLLARAWLDPAAQARLAAQGLPASAGSRLQA